MALPCHMVRDVERIRACLPGTSGREAWGIDAGLEIKTNVAQFFPPWTVTRDIWHDALRPDVSGVAVDALLFHEAGSRLVHRYRVYKDPFPHPALRHRVIPRLLSCVCRAMAIARLTHLRISIPSSGAPPGQVPVECFPEAADSATLANIVELVPSCRHVCKYPYQGLIGDSRNCLYYCQPSCQTHHPNQHPWPAGPVVVS